MCDVGTALKVGASMMSGMAEKRDQERHAAAQHRAAVSSMNSEGNQANLKFEEENRQAVQEAYDLALQNRAHQATFLVQAAENGVAGISVNEAFMALKNSAARSSNRHTQELASRRVAHQSHLDSLYAKAGGRINAAAPTKSSSDVLLDGVSTGISSGHQAGLFDDLKIG